MDAYELGVKVLDVVRAHVVRNQSRVQELLQGNKVIVLAESALYFAWWASGAVEGALPERQARAVLQAMHAELSQEFAGAGVTPAKFAQRLEQRYRVYDEAAVSAPDGRAVLEIGKRFVAFVNPELASDIGQEFVAATMVAAMGADLAAEVESCL